MGIKKFNAITEYFNNGGNEGFEKKIFVGDNGQGDLLAAAMLLQNEKIDRAYIHKVVPQNKAVLGEESVKTFCSDWQQHSGKQTLTMVPNEQMKAGSNYDTIKNRITFFENHNEILEEERLLTVDEIQQSKKKRRGL